jgi:hypothetical protein
MPKSTRIPEYRKGGRCYNEKHNPSKKMAKKLWHSYCLFLIEFRTILFLYVWHSYFYFIKFRTLLCGSALYCLVQDIIVPAQLRPGIPEIAGQKKKDYGSR